MGYLEWITDTRKASITARLHQVEGEEVTRRAGEDGERVSRNTPCHPRLSYRSTKNSHSTRLVLDRAPSERRGTPFLLPAPPLLLNVLVLCKTLYCRTGSLYTVSVDPGDEDLPLVVVHKNSCDHLRPSDFPRARDTTGDYA